MAKRRNEKEESESARDRYDDELLSANWNPVIDLLGASCAKTKDEASADPSRKIAEEDPEAFLKRIYKLGN
jgi:hypothetical protein